jgi:hypothetical protein
MSTLRQHLPRRGFCAGEVDNIATMGRVARALRWRPATSRQAWLAAVAGSGVVLGGVYAVERAAGWHPGFWTLVSPAVLTLVAHGYFIGARREPRPIAHDTQPDQASTTLMAPPDIPWEVVCLVQQGEKILAIKRYRQLNGGVGLKEAKDIIDAI